MAKMSDIVAGLEIFQRYEDSSVAAEHDVIYACDTPAGEMLAGEVQQLGNLGWHWDDYHDCWYHFT